MPEGEDRIGSAQSFWKLLDGAWETNGGATIQREYRLLAFRSILASGHPPNNLEANWRWKLCLWTPADRVEFMDTMKHAHDSQLAGHPEMKSLQY